MRLSSIRALVSFSLLATLHVAAAPARDAIALRNWTVPFAAHPPASVNTLTNTPPAHFIGVSPCRVADTRNAPGPYGGPMLNADETRSYNIANSGCGVPAAAAYSLNFTIVNYVGRGNLKAYATGTTEPVSSISNFGSGLPIGNAAIVAGDVNGSINVTVSGPTNLIIDINGYFKEGVVTGLTAGTGLTITGTNNLTVGIAQGGVGANEIKSTEVQKRVIGTCANGAITAVNGDGTVACGGASGVAGAQLFFHGLHTYIVPAGIILLEVEAWAGGGGGQGSASGLGNGGGGGSYGRVILQVTPGSQLTVVVGAGGMGGQLSRGSDGGDTKISFQGTDQLVVPGGKGGTSAAHGLGGGSISSSGIVFQQQLGSNCCGSTGGNAAYGLEFGLGGDGALAGGLAGGHGFMRIIPSP